MVRSHATAEKSGNDDGTAPAFGGKYFKTLGFDDNLNGKIGGDGAADRAESVSGIASANAMHDLHDQNAAEGNIEAIWESLTDDDGDPNAGDLGEVDMMHDADDTDTDDDETATDDNLVHLDGLGDNYPAGDNFGDSVRECTEADGGDNDDGTICDATWTITREVLFADGTFGCTATRPVTITCTWDADGSIAQGRNAIPQNLPPPPTWTTSSSARRSKDLRLLRFVRSESNGNPGAIRLRGSSLARTH